MADFMDLYQRSDLAALRAACAQRPLDIWDLCVACAGGHLAVAQWLHTVCQFALADVQSALMVVCSNDWVNGLRWVQRTWGIPPATRDLACEQAPAGGACAAYLQGLCALRWSPSTHADFPLASRRAALAALLVRERQARDDLLSPVPPLPTELWLHLLSYLPVW